MATLAPGQDPTIERHVLLAQDPHAHRARAWWNCLVVLALSTLLFAVYWQLYFVGIRSSDGANYAAVARNVATGHGLLSSVIQPGLLDVVPSGPEGQAFVIQAPLWPLLLASAFKVAGPSETTLLMVSGTLFVLVMVGSWWLTLLWTRSIFWAYVAWALLICNPYAIGTALAGANVMLQAALLLAIFLAGGAGPAAWNVILVGGLLGLACVTRENSLFMFPAIAIMWHERLSMDSCAGPRRPSLLFLRSTAARNRLLVALAAVGMLAIIPIRIEAARKAALIGHADAPVLRMTFLYYTSIGDQGWYFLYRHPMLAIDPKDFFREHPGELVWKMAYQFYALFLRETAPAMLSFLPWFVPVLVPRFAPTSRGRAGILAALVFIAVQVVIGAMTILNFIYFFALLPVLAAGIGATAVGIWARASAARHRWGWRALLAYALAPLVLNVAFLATGRKPGTGDYHLSAAAENALATFILRHTTPGSVVTCSHSALMAWKTGRTILTYSVHPQYTVGDTPMWRAIDGRLPIAYIVLNTLASETPDRLLLPGFHLVATTSLAGEGTAWMFARGGAARPEQPAAGHAPRGHEGAVSSGDRFPPPYMSPGAHPSIDTLGRRARFARVIIRGRMPEAPGPSISLRQFAGAAPVRPKCAFRPSGLPFGGGASATLRSANKKA